MQESLQKFGQIMGVIRNKLSERGDFHTLSLDGTFKFCMTISSQIKHGVSRIKADSSGTAAGANAGQRKGSQEKKRAAAAKKGEAEGEKHTLLTIRSASGCLVSAQLQFSERTELSLKSVTSVSARIKEELIHLATDSPEDWDNPDVFTALGALEVLSADPLHRYFEVGSFYHSKNELSPLIKVLQLKFAASKNPDTKGAKSGLPWW